MKNGNTLLRILSRSALPLQDKFFVGGGLSMQNDMPDEIVQRIMRYVDNHGWNWGIIKRLINGRFGTAYSTEQLQRAYRKGDIAMKYR